MNTKKKLCYQVIYQTLIFGIPLIVSPYLTRILGADNLGIFTFINSIGNYFVIMSMMGIQSYGCRSIAQVQKDKKKIAEVFWEIFFAHFIVSVFSIFVYVFLIFVYVKNNITVYVCVLFCVISAVFDCTWFYYGNENFRTVIFRNMIVKVLEVICIFSFVKSQNDLVMYSFIVSASILLGHLIVIPDILKKVGFHVPKVSNIIKHFPSLLILSVAVIATSVYATLDKTLLGVLDTKTSVAFYEYSEKIVKAPVQIIATVGTVVLPKVSLYVANKSFEKIKHCIKNSIIWVGFTGFAFSFGLAAISNKFVEIYYGHEFSACAEYIVLLSPLILIITCGHIIRNQYLIPFGKDLQYIGSLIICAIVNLMLNFTLIPLFSVKGAICATLIAEFVGCILQLFFARKFIPIVKYFKQLIPFCIIGIIMYRTIKYLDKMLSYSVDSLLFEIFIGCIIYLILGLGYLRNYKKEIWYSLLNKKNLIND